MPQCVNRQVVHAINRFVIQKLRTHTHGLVMSERTQVPVQNQSQSDSGFKDLLLVKNSSQGASVQHMEICTGLQRHTYPDHH